MYHVIHADGLTVDYYTTNSYTEGNNPGCVMHNHTETHEILADGSVQWALDYVDPTDVDPAVEVYDYAFVLETYTDRMSTYTAATLPPVCPPI